MAYFSPKLYDVAVNGTLSWEFQPRKAQHFYALSTGWSNAMPWKNPANSTDTHSDALSTYSSSNSNAGYNNVYVHTIVDWCTDTNYVYWPSISASVLHDTNKSIFTLNSSKSASIKLTPGVFSFSKHAAGAGYGDFERVLRSYTMDGTTDGGADQFSTNFIGQMGGISPSAIYGPFVMFSVSAAIYSSLPNTITDGETFPTTNIINGGVENTKIYTIHTADPDNYFYFEQYASDIFSNTKLAEGALYGNDSCDNAQRIISDDDNFTKIVGPSSTFPRSKVGIFGTEYFDSVSNISLDAANNSSIYLLVKTTVRFYYNAYFNNGTRAPYYLNTCVNADSFPAKIISWEVWGPFRVLYAPSTITLETAYDFSGKTYLNYGDNGGVFGLPTVSVDNSHSSGTNFLGFEFNNLIRLKYEFNSYPAEVGYIPQTTNFNNGLVRNNNDYSVNNTNHIVYQYFNVAPKLITSFAESYDASIYIGGSFMNSTLHDMHIYNAYRVYVYPATAFSVSGTTISPTTNATPYSYSFDSEGNIVVDNVEVKNNSTNVLYLREVIEEKYIGNSNDVETTFVDYNSSLDENLDTVDVFTTTEIVESDVDKLQNISVSSYTLNSANEVTPSQESILTMTANSLFSTNKLYSSNNVKIYKVSFDVSVLQNNTTETSLTVCFDNANVFTSGMKTLKINLTPSSVVSSIDASILKGEDQNDPIVEIPLHKSSTLTTYTYIPWEPSETGYNNEHTTSPILLWLQTGYTADGGTPTNIGYVATIDSSSSIEFGPNTSGSQWNQRDGSLGDMSNNMISFKVKSPGVTTLTLTSKDGGTSAATSTYVIAVYTPVASIRFTGGKASDPSSSDIQIGTAAYVNLWSVPDEYHINDNTYPSVQSIWNDSAYRVNILFNDCSGNIITGGQNIDGALSPIYGRQGFGTSAQVSIAPGLYFGASNYSNVTYQQVVTNTDNRLFNTSPLSAGTGQVTMYLFPGDASNNSYPYPSSGLAYVTINNIKKTSSDPHSISEQFGVKINKTTDTITNVIPDPSNHMIEGSYVAGEPIKYTVSVNGDEPMNTWNLSATEEDELGITYSYDNNGHITVTFPVSMASPWTGDIIITMINHYGQPVIYTVENVSVIPSVSSLSISYNGNIIATESSTGYIANRDDPFYWYTLNTSTERETFNLVGTVATGNINWTVSPANEELSPIPASSSSTSEQSLEFYFNTRRNNNNYNYTITAESSAVSSIHAIAYIVPMRITTLTYIERTGSGALNPGDSTTISIYTNGNEDVVLADALSYVVVLDNNGTAVSNPQITFSNPTLITQSGTGFNGVQYTVTVDNGIASNKTLYLHTRFTNKDGAVIDSSTSCGRYVELNINKSEATSITLKKSSDDSIIEGSLGNYWFAPNDVFGFYGEVAGATLSDELKNINYTLTQQSSLNVVAFTDTVNNVPSGKSSGTVTLKFKDSNNANRSRYCTVTAESIQTSGITTSFKFTPLRISDNLGISITNNIITLGGSTNSTEVPLTINGDESIADASLQYKVNSGSYSYTVPNIIDVTSQVQSGNRGKTYTITVNSNVTTTTTITIKGLFLPHGASSNLSSSEVTLTVKPSASQYSISAAIDSSRNSADKNKLYHDTESSDIIKINVSLGSLVNSYIVYMPSSTPSSYNEVLEQYVGGSWSTIKRDTTGAVNVSDTTIYVRVASLNIGSNPSLTLRFRANDKDTASSSYDEVELTLQLGKIKYSQHTASGDSTSWRGTQGDSSLYNGDTVQFISSCSPVAGSSATLGNTSVVWSNNSNFISGSTSSDYSTSNASYTGRSSASNGNTTIVTFGFKYSADIPAAVKGSNRYAVSHIFTVTSLGDSSSGNSLSLTPTERIIETNGSSANTTYTVVRGAYVNPVTVSNISYSKVSGDPGSKTLSTSVSGDTITSTVSGDPDTPCIYRISLTTTNVLGDTITASNAATLYWRSKAQASVTVTPATSNDGSINYPKGDYEITTTYDIIAGSNIASVRFVKIWKDSINPGIPTSSVNGTVNNNSLILTAGNIPSEDATYNICLEVTTNFGDTLTIENAGTVYWAAGNTSFVLTTDPIDSSVSGFGGSASNGAEYVEYTVTCTHKNGEQIISDTWSVVSSETWCKCSAYSGSDGDKIRVYAQGECYGSNRVANLTFTSSHNGAGSSTHTAHLTQRYLTVTPEIAINPTSLTPFGAEASSTSKTVEVTRCVYVKKDSLATSSIPSREVQATWNRTQSSESSWLSLNNTSGSQVTNINVIENIDTSSRSAVVTFTTVKPGEFPSGLEITPASVNITVTQNATTYSTCVFEIDGVNDNRTLPVKAAAADVSLGISCYYTKTQSSAGVKVYPGWTISSIKDGNGNNIDWISNKPQQTTDSELWISIGVNATSNPRTGVITLVSNQYIVGSKTYVSSVTRTIRVEQGNAAVDFNVATINKTYDVTGVNAVNYNDLKVNTSGTDASWQMSLTDSASFITGVKAKKISGGEVIEPATGVEVKGDASIAADFVSPNLLNGGQVTSSIPLYSIRRTITASRTASLTVVAVDNTDSTGTVNIIQAGYSWTPSITTTLTKNGIFDASDNSATLIINSNFDYTVTVPAWMNCTLDSNYPGIFDNNDGETITRERRYNITFNCNFSNNQQTGTIEIRNSKHCTDEGELIGQQSKSLPVSQSTGTRSIKLLHNNHEVNTGSEELRFSSLGEERQFVVKAICTDWTAVSSVDWITINPTLNTTTPSSYENNQQITITVSPNSNTKQGRTASIVFTSVQDNTWNVTYDIVQEQASIYFVLATSLQDLKDHINGDISLDFITSETSYSIGNHISINGESQTYYIMYYYGSSEQTGANATANAFCSTFVTPMLISSSSSPDFVDIQPPANSNLYKLVIQISGNESVLSRNIAVALTCGASSNLRINFLGVQDANNYDAEFDVTGELGNYVIGKGWTIPVYGGNYTFTIKNLLDNDSIIVDDIFLDEDINENHDHSSEDYKTWYSVVVPQEAIGSTPRAVTITINPYNIKESTESESAPVEARLNQKFYSVKVTAHSSSRPTASFTRYLRDNNSNIIQAVQESIEVYSQTSWELLSNDDIIDTETGSKRVYSRNENYGSVSKTVYSEDTGRDLFGTNTPSSIDEEEPISKIAAATAGNGSLALDVRVGVRK